MTDQILIFAILFAALVLFVWGRFRYDVVALLALMAVAFTGLLPIDQVFSGFSNPAVITVAAILVVSQALTNAGIADVMSRWLTSAGNRPVVHLALLMIIVIVASSFMNNVGALALTMPVAIRLARQSNYSPSRLLMPLAFGSLLGGMTTLIGTPPNILISSYRAGALGEPYNMFAFTPVGVVIAIGCGLLIILLAPRLLPDRAAQDAGDDLFHMEDYLLEVRVPEGSKLAGQPLSAVSATGIDVLVVALLRNKQRVAAPSGYEEIRPGDLLLVEINSTALEQFLETTGLEPEATPDLAQELLRSDDVSLQEVVVSANSLLVGSTARELNIRWRYGINVLAVARQGERMEQRLGNIAFRAGDVLLLQIKGRNVAETLRELRCLPLAQRPLRIGVPRRLVVAGSIFAAAIVASALQWMPIQLAFFSRGHPHGHVGLVDPAAGLRRYRVAGHHPPGGDDPRRHGAGGDRRRGDYRQLHQPDRQPAAGLGHPGYLDGHHHDPLGYHQQRRHRGADGANRHWRGPGNRRATRCLPHGRGHRFLVRLPDAHRSSIQHTGHGSGRLSFRRLLETGSAGGNPPVDHIGSHVAHCLGIEPNIHIVLTISR